MRIINEILKKIKCTRNNYTTNVVNILREDYTGHDNNNSLRNIKK